MDRNTFGEICARRSVCWGTVICEYFAPQTVRVMARAGYDWLWLECEHCHASYETMREVVRTADDMGVVSVLRVAQTDYALIAQAYDLGVGGVIVPRVETPEQMRHIVDCAKYPPVGRRGFGISPAVYGKRNMSMKERLDDQNSRRFLFIQVESQDAVGRVDEIIDAAAGQLNGVFFGPADFLVDIGKPDAFDAPELDAAVRRVSQACAAGGISNGVPVGTLTGAKWWVDRGFNLVTLSNDLAFMENTAAEARHALSEIG